MNIPAKEGCFHINGRYERDDLCEACFQWLDDNCGEGSDQSSPEGSQQAPCLEGGNDGDALAAPLPSGDSETI